jgi:hypothetical protein
VGPKVYHHNHRFCRILVEGFDAEPGLYHKILQNGGGSESMNWIRYDFFISYSREDSASTDALTEAIRGRGYSVFYDKSSMLVGERWKTRLEKAIGSSRICVLCWSEHAKKSEYVPFEYSRAEGLKKPVLPWLLDTTPLPAMIEIHGIVEQDPVIAADLLTKRAGWRLTLRRRLSICAIFLLMATLFLIYLGTHRPAPQWEFSGRIIDSETLFPIAGVEVDAEQRFKTFTDKDGRYVLHLPSPRTQYIHLVFLKEGYKGEVPVDVPSDVPFNTDMVRAR